MPLTSLPIQKAPLSEEPQSTNLDSSFSVATAPAGIIPKNSIAAASACINVPSQGKDWVMAVAGDEAQPVTLSSSIVATTELDTGSQINMPVHPNAEQVNSEHFLSAVEGLVTAPDICQPAVDVGGSEKTLSQSAPTFISGDSLPSQAGPGIYGQAAIDQTSLSHDIGPSSEGSAFLTIATQKHDGS
ncbi:hypothetical protein BJ165DRAFT_20771 [Panaeolus papilionaceus]|nr:hypothetical protein BJ165DRAFT_20771 [Panaeolus papilionaceus]